MSRTPIATARTRARRPQQGMTLLELLVVIALLSVVGFMALSQVGDDLGQARYEDTRSRLIALRRAIVGYEEPVFNGQRLFSGYAADNGVIPTTADGGLAALVNEGAFEPYGLIMPRFDPDNDDDWLDDIDVTGARLFKGWRGPYLVTRPGEKDIDPTNPKPAYRDAWGNQGASISADALDFGWNTTAPEANSIKIISLGRDGAPDPALPAEPEMYDADVSTVIENDDWMVHLPANWSLGVTAPGADLVVKNNTDCLRLSLLVYENDVTSGGSWRSITSECLYPATTGSAGLYGSCIDGNDDKRLSINDDPDTTGPGENEYWPVSCSSTAVFPGDEWIPQGRHVLILVGDLNGILDDGDQACQRPNDCDVSTYLVPPHTIGDDPDVTNAELPSSVRVTEYQPFLVAPVDFYSGVAPPTSLQLKVAW